MVLAAIKFYRSTLLCELISLTISIHVMSNSTFKDIVNLTLITENTAVSGASANGKRSG